MLKEIKQIRELEIIEKELSSISAGLLALSAEEGEKIIQVPSTFLYYDKNIYLFVFNQDLIEQIRLDTQASFSTIRTEKFRRNSKDSSFKYEYFSITIKGHIKRIDDTKTFEDVKSKYTAKYTFSASDESDLLMENLMIIDTQEIQAVEEKGA